MHPFKSLLEFSKHFDTEDKCREFLEYHRWGGVPTCPHCGCTDVCRFKRGKLFKCRAKLCRKKFSVTVGTVMESTKLPLTKWFLAIYVATNHSKGISSHQLANYADVPQKTAWFLLHRVREMLNQKSEQPLSNLVEVDETYIGAKNKNRHSDKRKKYGKKKLRGRSLEDKIPVVGLLERGGRLITVATKDTKGNTLKPLVRQWVEEGSILLTDEYGAYKGLDKSYSHKIVNHSTGQYVDGVAHTNSVEGYWSIFKRCIYGIYHSVSRKHMYRYCDEVTYRYNTRRYTQDQRFAATLSKCNGRLKYDDLIRGDDLPDLAGVDYLERVTKIKTKFDELLEMIEAN